MHTSSQCAVVPEASCGPVTPSVSGQENSTPAPAKDARKLCPPRVQGSFKLSPLVAAISREESFSMILNL